MAMNKISTNVLKPGMVFDKAVYIDMNNILVAPMVPIKEDDINRLIKWGIEEVETSGEIIKEGVVLSSKDTSIKDRINKLTRLAKNGDVTASKLKERDISDIYNDTLELVEDIFEHVRNGAGYNKDKVLKAVDILIEEVKRDENKAISEVTRDHEGKYIHTLCVSVAILSIVTGISLAFAKHRLVTLATGALLHDIGMVRVPNYITEKKDTLTPDEYNRIKTHTLYGYRIISRELNLNNEIASIALQHHENYSGNGYPRKLKSDDISVYARIVSICDVFTAMTRKRSYRDEYLLYTAMKSILSGSSKKFDPNIVRVFLSNMALYPVGSIVQLNNGVVGSVVSANPELPLRPNILVIIDEFGEKVNKEKILDLQEKQSLFITKSLDKSALEKLKNE